MPLVPRKKLFGSSSFNQTVGKEGRVARVELRAPGVKRVAPPAPGGAMLTVLTIPFPERRSVNGPPLVLSRYQKLSVYGWPVTQPEVISCQIDELRVVPAWEAIKCKL